MLTHTNDWRSFYRILMNLKQDGFDAKDKLVIYNHITELAGKKNLGEGVEELLKTMSAEMQASIL
jgi:hypothetical protein